MINGNLGTRVTIYDKTTGAVVTGPFLLETLGSGGACAQGHGDPIALFDRLANRWLLSEFAETGNHLCVYISQTVDPTGAYFRYDMPTAEFPDYPKYSVWPNAYYVTTNESTVGVYAMDRTKMLLGQAATMQRFAATALAGFPFQALTPADFDGSTAPPANAPGYFARHRDDEVHNAGSNNTTKDFIEIWQLQPDFATPANSVLSGPTNVDVASFDSHLCGLVAFNCFPQPGSATTLDPLREVVMWRLQYRNFGSYAALVGNFTVDVNATDRGGIRWFELRKTGGGAWTLFQEGTYSPDATNRWMGSIAMDQSGNIALGYSASSGSVSPGLRFTGRQAADAAGTMTTSETTIIAGSASNTNQRWGDYSAMTVDPTDDCTFWFTGQYSPASTWATRITKMKFDSCSSTPTPIIAANGSSITSQNFSPANAAIDPGERVTVSFTLINNGSAATSNLVATLLNTGGVTAASAAQNYGAIAPAASLARSFSLTASGTCGGTLTATLQLQDGATNLGNITYTFTLGALVPSNTTESFDTVTAPALPSGWTTAATGAESPWVTSTTSPFAGANAAFAPDPNTTGHTELVTPIFVIPASGSQLTFKNNYNTESTYDGMVLEISINGGAFADITTGGNAFVSGAYNSTLSGANASLGGRQAWSGNSAGYVTSTINLPSGANGQSVRLKWRMATDSSVGGTGVRIDSLAITSSSAVCSSVPAAFTNDPLAAGTTVVSAVHITELRTRIDAQRVRFGLGGYTWTDGTLSPAGTVQIKAVHITEMRLALNQAYAARPLTAPTYTDPGLGSGTTVSAIHITELRNAVIILEGS
jgi:hypothetical protein